MSSTAGAASAFTSAQPADQVTPWIVREIVGSEVGLSEPLTLSYAGGDELLVVPVDGGARLVSLDEQDRGPADALPPGLVDASIVALPNGGLAAVNADLELVEVDGSNATATSTPISGIDPDAAVIASAVASDGSVVVLQDEGIIRIPQGADGELAPELATQVPLPNAAKRARAVAVHPDSGDLFVLDRPRRTIHQLDRDGRSTASFDIAALGLARPTSMAFAPTGDPTDPVADVNLYLADQRDAGGAIVEVSLTAMMAVPSTVTATLENTIDTSQWTPASPDPAGIAAAPSGQGLIVVDSEVNEMPLYAGTNTWEVSLDGTIITRTSNTLSYTHEPTGISMDPAAGVVYLADDDLREIFVVDLGADGLLHSADDIVTSFDTQVFGSTDPEGVAYSPNDGRVYIVDGLGREVYAVDPGANTIFDGVAPTGDDVVTNFDVDQYGQLDPEGIEVNGSTGNILISSGRAEQVAVVTPDGATLVSVIDISASNGDAAGLALATASAGGGLNMYIADRGVDNNVDPNENDGKIYEFSIPGGFGNQAPDVSAGPNVSVELSTGVTLAGVVSDDGLPNPPAATTFVWTQTAGSPATIVNPTQLNTAVTGTQTGVYEFTLTADDSETISSDTVVITVVADGTLIYTVEKRVSASSDDAEQRPSGNISLTSSDLEMTLDAGGSQVVGLRFTTVDVPADALITNAYVQFVVDEANSDPTTLNIRGQAADSPPTFVNSPNNISGRASTASSVAWVPPSWLTVGAAGVNQRTPDLATIVQELVDRPGWAPNNAMVFVVTGTGERVAEAFDSGALTAPLLHIEYAIDDPNRVITPTGTGGPEGNVGTKVFNIPFTLSSASALPISMDWVTINYEATSPDDYVGGSGTLVIPAGVTQWTFPLTVNGDTTVEPREWAVVSFTNPERANMGGFWGLGLVWILNDD